MVRFLHLTSLCMNALFWVFGLGLSVYLAGTATGLIRMASSSIHYTTFMFAVMSMSGFITLQELAERKLHDPQGNDALFWVKFAIAWIGTIAAIVSSGYVRLHAIHLETTQPFFNPFEFKVGLVLVVSVLILNWFHWGSLLTVIIGLSVVYFFYGYLIPYPLLTTPRYDPEFVMNYLGLGTNEGLFWFMREAADSIWFLVIFAGALFAVGTLRMVVEVGKAGGNRVAGGAAFPAIIGSGIVAAIMGTAVSNVVLTGRFTIPMMKSKGYSAPMAGAIEATAGTAGQIMPPVLGLAAFIIAALLNIPYVDIALAAVIPGLLYMTGVTSGVLVYAWRNRLPKLTEPVDVRLILRLAPTFLVSFIAVMYMLLAYYTPSYAGLVGSVIALTLGLFQGKYRPKWPEVVSAFRDALSMAAILSLLLIAIGPLGQVFLTTNLSNRLGTILILVLPNSELLLLIGAAILALILGMGLPTPVAYIVVALALVPFLQQLGVEPLMAHFFVFYFACYSALTPPVAVAALAAAKIAKAGFLETARDAMKLMLTTFVIPFAFVYYPSLMGFPHLKWEVLVPIVTCLLLQWTVSVTCYGYFSRDLSAFERTIFGIISFAGYGALCDRGIYSNLLFGAMLLVMLAYMFLSGKAARRSVIIAQPSHIQPAQKLPDEALPIEGRFE
ncbi:MAG: TRAP transporter permease [Pseudolabrys sp.]